MTAAPVGTTFLAADSGPSNGSGASLHAVLGEAATAHAGRGWADEGGAIVAFPSAADALAAAVAARRIWRRRRGPDVPLRLAVHAGDARREGDDGRHAGPGVSYCRRLREIAHPGQTLVSAGAAGAAADRLPAGAVLDDLGVHRLRDLSPPGRVFALRDGDDTGERPVLRSLDASPNNLPSRLTTFVGREAELAELHARLAGAHLLTIAGPGGSGKTRLLGQLAAEQAGRWPDGVWWVELGALVDPAQVAATVAGVLDVLVDPARGAVGSLGAQVASRRLLLCLDNCEHVLEAAAGVAEALRDAPDVSIVATSREPLGLTGEVVWRLSPLAPRDARELFLERAAQVQPDLAVDADADAAIASMCTRLDGSPLALELAAAWLRTLTPRQIEAGLDDRFSLLVRSPRDALPRHASLLASMAWSHDLLDEPDRAVLRRLAIFAGDFDLAAARAVCAGEGVADDAVMGALARLVDKSLVVAQGAGDEVRYRLPESIREYAMDRLRAAGERRAAADRHLDHRLAQVRDAAPDLEHDKDRWRTALARDYENLRAAIEHGLEAEDPERGRRLAAGLPWLWQLHRQGREGMQILQRAIARAPGERSALQAHLLAGIALVADTADPLDVELDAASRAAELAAEHGDERLLSLCLALAAVGRFYTDLDGARETALEAERIAERAGERFVVDAGRALRGILLHLRDEHAEAQALLSEAAERLTARGDRGVGSTALAFHSGSALLTGDVQRARELAERSMAIAAPLADHLRIGMGRSALALALGAGGDVPGGLAALAPVLPLVAGADTPFLPEVDRALGTLHLWAGDAEQALGWLTAEARSTDGGRPTYLAVRALPPLAAAQRQTGRAGDAAATAARAVELAREREMPAVLADALAEQARQAGGEDAFELHHEALAIRAERGLRGGVIESLEAVAALGTGSAEQDVRLLAAAAAARDALSLPVRPVDRAERAACEAALRDDLGDGFEAAWRAGAALSLDDATAYARRARGSRRRPDHGWASLTPAEVEVVSLAVDGLTNPEIGARLFMSRSTVKTHLSHVYAKLGVANRTELAARSGDR
ncbi:MAG TPA: LuxR C-terminal-related transcriptional regulator [Solirubrobacteraceae bacterium]|nr:LuxR C-terminal-related transcriptional regulator [Solirubrobacteraceae bacterium]